MVTLVIAEDQYRTGLVTFINVLQAENAELNAKDQLTQADALAVTDLVAVYKALGGGWASPSASVSDGTASKPDLSMSPKTGQKFAKGANP